MSDADAPRLTREGVRQALAGQVLLAPLTRAGNLPFRRLCVEHGARITCSEMVLARKLTRRGSRERVLLRRHPSEALFGVQLAGRTEPDLAAASAIAVAAGADFIDLNFGCPIDSAVRHGYGAALLEKPRRLERLVRAVRDAVERPLFVKIRTGFREGKENALEIAAAAEAGGADALTIHGRTREQRYRRPADWERIEAVAAALSIPVIGNGDILDADDARARLESSGCTAVMVARGALIHPWLWRDLEAGTARPRTAAERLQVMRRWIELALEHWGDDEHGYLRLRPFLELHLDFWRRYVPPDRADIEVGLQARATFTPADELEDLLQAKGDDGIERAAAYLLEPFDPPPVALQPAKEAAAERWG